MDEKRLKFLSFVLIIFLNQTYAQSVPLLVCPIGGDQGHALSVYQNDLFCKKSVNCTNIEKAFPGLSVIALHNGEWNEMDLILSNLSSCGVRIRVEKISETIPEHVCQVDQRMGILSFTDFRTEFIQKNAGLKRCAIDRLSENDELLKRLFSVCPITYLLSGNGSCDANFSSALALKINRLAEGDILISNDVIRVGTNPATPFVNKVHNEKYDNFTYTGLVFEILSRIGEAYNLQYILRITGKNFFYVKSILNRFKVSEPPDRQYGSPYSNGTWNGLIGMLQRKEVDVIAADLTISYPRQQVVDFSVPFYFESIGILVELPTEKAQKFWTVIYLFTSIDWLAIAVSLCFAALYVHLLPEFNKDGIKSGFKDLSQSFWYIYSGLVNQGGEIIPRTLASRAFLIFWWIYVLLITSIYSGLLIAYVTRNNVNMPFKDLNGLAEAVASNTYKVCVVNNTAYQASLFNNPDHDSTTLKKFLERNPSYLVSTPELCAEILLNEPNVAYIDQMILLQNVQNEHCLRKTFILLNDYFYSRYFGFAFQKGSTLKDLFTQEIVGILDTGNIQLWKSHHTLRNKFCLIVNPDDIISVESKPLKIEEIAGAFILLAIGVVSSIMYFIGEWSFRRKSKMKHLNNQSDKM